MLSIVDSILGVVFHILDPAVARFHFFSSKIIVINREDSSFIGPVIFSMYKHVCKQEFLLCGRKRLDQFAAQAGKS
uniref:Uncharacterized protein n=1 Tax=Arion vulgaris TaxID=1028688 RepID=A0A0B7BIQ6_9EUPU